MNLILKIKQIIKEFCSLDSVSLDAIELTNDLSKMLDDDQQKEYEMENKQWKHINYMKYQKISGTKN